MAQEYKRHWSELKVKEILVPEKRVSLEYEKNVIPLFYLIEILKKENKTLKETKDLLLPKLISGEIDVSNIDIQL